MTQKRYISLAKDIQGLADKAVRSKVVGMLVKVFTDERPAKFHGSVFYNACKVAVPAEVKSEEKARFNQSEEAYNKFQDKMTKVLTNAGLL